MPELARKASGLRMHSKKVFFISGFWFLSSFVHKILFLGPVQWVNLAKKVLQEIIFLIFLIYFIYLVNVQCDSSFLKPIDTTAVNRGMYYIELRTYVRVSVTFTSSIKYIIMHVLFLLLYIISRNLMLFNYFNQKSF